MCVLQWSFIHDLCLYGFCVWSAKVLRKVLHDVNVMYSIYIMYFSLHYGCLYVCERANAPHSPRKSSLLSWWDEKQGKILPAVIWASVLTRSHSKASYPYSTFMKYSCWWQSKKSSIMKLWPGHKARVAIFCIMRQLSLPEAN